ncbi:MAG: hypothetical protein MJZ20_02995 [Bacteroidaceae bacterium]|nr:hypothetical protein [Bacteroidaceae bacterium]
MSGYHIQFTYKGKTNNDPLGPAPSSGSIDARPHLVVTSFNPDNGEADAFLGMDSITDSNYDGTLKYDYGAKYRDVAKIRITMVKSDYSDLTLYDFREIARWLTGAKQSSWLDMQMPSSSILGTYQTAYSFLCKCTSLSQYKLDGRVIGVIAIFESVTPWAYSPLQNIKIKNGNSEIISGTQSHPFTFTLNNQSDDIYNYLYPSVSITNGSQDSFTLTNTTLEYYESSAQNATTSMVDVVDGEVVVLTNRGVILTDSAQGAGNRFNWVWPKMLPGDNEFSFVGEGKIIFAYRYPIKVGDCILGLDDRIHEVNMEDPTWEYATDLEVRAAFLAAYESIFGGGTYES